MPQVGTPSRLLNKRPFTNTNIRKMECQLKKEPEGEEGLPKPYLIPYKYTDFYITK